MVLLRLVTRSVGFASTMILARLLVPEDFGLVALAMMAFGLLEVMGRFGLELSLIKEQQADRAHYDTAWTLQIIKGVAVGSLLALTAPLWASFFDDGRLEAILRVFAVMALVEGLRNIGIVDFRKELRFGAVFKLELACRLGGTAAALILALVWRSYWAMIVGVFVEQALLTLLSYAVHPYRPRISFKAWHSIFEFSKWVFVNNLLMFLNRRSDIFVLGRLAAIDAVGHYSIAKQISTLASDEIVMPATRSFFPSFSKIADDPDRLGGFYLSAMSLVLLIGLPLAVGVACTGQLLVRVAFGEQWLAAVPILQLLAIYGILRVNFGTGTSILLALGRPGLATALSATRFGLQMPLMLYGATVAGATGVAVAMVAAAAARLVLNTVVISALLRIEPQRTVAATWRSIVSALVMAGVLTPVEDWLPADPDLLLALAELLLLVGLGAATYAGSCLALWALSRFPRHAEWQVIAMLREQVDQRRATS